jgi:hypothetical protein
LQLEANTATNAPILSAQGSDTNIDLNLTTKGTGSFKINNAGGTVAEFNDGGTATPANAFLFAAGGTAGTRALIRATGGPLTLLTSGANSVNFATNGLSTNIQAVVSHTASAVNFVQVTGAATNNYPIISAIGSDTNVGMLLRVKGAPAGPGFRIENNNGANVCFAVTTSGANVVNYMRADPAAAGSAVGMSAQGSDTNIPLVLQPKGTGALQAQLNDGTATGGNARGANAVDWQTSRGSAGQIASAQQSVLGGGTNNTVSGAIAGIFSGGFNTASAQYSVIAGGAANNANSYGAGVVTGQSNTAAGWYNFIGGGQLNSATSISAVTTQSATMNGTTAVTLSGSNASIRVGQLITGTSIATNTYVAAISGTSLTLSQAASGSSTSTLSFFTPHGVVVGGGNNQATGSYSFIGGGGDAGTAANRNVASGDWSVVVGGVKNTNAGAWSFIGAGGSNTSGSFFSGNTIASFATNSAIVSGTGNSANAHYSFIGAGGGNIVNANYTAIAGGANGTTRGIVGNAVFPACSSPIANSSGVSQAALLLLARQTTDATPTALASDSNAAGTTNQVILPNNSAYFFRGEVISGVTGGGNTKGWTIEGVIKRGANAASTTLVGVTVMSTHGDIGAAAWTIAVTADTTNGGLRVTFTGQAATTIRTVCQIRTTEMTF